MARTGLTPPAGTKVYHTSTSVIWVGDDDIARVVVLPGAKLGLREAEEQLAAFPEELARPRPFLIDMRQIHSMDREARNCFRSRSRGPALALIVESPLSRTIGNFALGLSKMSMPTRLFTSPAEALRWLKGFVS
jgi:hypothetical protein